MQLLPFNLKRIRKQKKLLQKDLAQKAGIVHLYLSQIEQGVKVPSLKVVDEIAKALGVPIKALFENIPESKKVNDGIQ